MRKTLGEVDGWWWRSKAVLTTQTTWNRTSITFLRPNILAKKNARNLQQSPLPLPSKALQEKEEEFERAALGDFFFITPTNSFPKPASESHTETRVPSKIITKNISEEQTLRWTAQQLVLLKAKGNEFLFNSKLFDIGRIGKQKLGKYDMPYQKLTRDDKDCTEQFKAGASSPLCLADGGEGDPKGWGLDNTFFWCHKTIYIFNMSRQIWLSHWHFYKPYIEEF